MSRIRTLTTVALAALVALGAPPMASAVFPGENGEILFVSGRPNDDAQADIFVTSSPLSAPGGALTPLLPGQHRHPSWSSQSDFVVFALHNGANHDLWLHDYRLGGSSNITLSATVTEDHPTFSPDGKRIAYESEVTDGSNQRDILIRNTDGSGPVVNLTDTPTQWEQTPVWDPKGRFIYYAHKDSAAATDLDVLREPPDNSSDVPQHLIDVNSATPEWQPEISPDGRRLCFTFGEFASASADVMVASIDGSGDPYEVSPTDPGTPVADYNCGWSPDGETIAFTNGAFGTGELMFAPADDSGPITPYGFNDSNNFDGNVDWARVPLECQGRVATVVGTARGEVVPGTAERDVIAAVQGDDTLRAKAGNDRACGGKGADRIIGRAGRDKLFGGPGPDIIRGGPDRDVCDGGGGRDEISCERVISG